MTTRAEIIRVARSMMGTPYHHLARIPHVGLDCAGLLVCVARECGIVAPDFDTPTYPVNPDGFSLVAGMDQWMGGQVSRDKMQAGDAIVVRSVKHPQHLAILGDYIGGGLTIIHASNNVVPARVVEHRLVFARGIEFVAAYKFSGVV